MNESTMDRFCVRLRADHPGYAVHVEPWESEGDPTIEFFIHVLFVPVDQLAQVSRRAWDLALEVFGEEDMPFHLTTVDPETSAKHFPQALEEHRRREGRRGA